MGELLGVQDASASLRQHAVLNGVAVGGYSSAVSRFFGWLGKYRFEEFPILPQFELRCLGGTSAAQLLAKPGNQQFLHDFGRCVAAQHVLARDANVD